MISHGFPCHSIISPLRKSAVLTTSVSSLRQNFVPVSGHQEGVFNAHAAPPFQINPRFHGDNHTGFQDLLAGRGHPGRFMNLNTHPMTGAMNETPPIPRTVYLVSGNAVDLGGFNT